MFPALPHDRSLRALLHRPRDRAPARIMRRAGRGRAFFLRRAL